MYLTVWSGHHGGGGGGREGFSTCFMAWIHFLTRPPFVTRGDNDIPSVYIEEHNIP